MISQEMLNLPRYWKSPCLYTATVWWEDILGPADTRKLVKNLGSSFW